MTYPACQGISLSTHSTVHPFSDQQQIKSLVRIPIFTDFDYSMIIEGLSNCLDHFGVKVNGFLIPYLRQKIE